MVFEFNIKRTIVMISINILQLMKSQGHLNTQLTQIKASLFTLASIVNIHI